MAKTNSAANRGNAIPFPHLTSQEALAAIALRNAERALRAVHGSGDISAARRALDLYAEEIGLCAGFGSDELLGFIAGDEAAGLAIEDIDELFFRRDAAACVATLALVRARR